ncbi:MAG: nickel pincer cofactor biosynthesis protein LarC [Chloroflexota bacterium]|nr:MAG: nickel pincer cofactor biosynthesis protein LarC [Chloroflexota bacterium]
MAIAYFDCYSGISGDMTLGALVDAGLSFDELRDAVAALPVGGYEIESTPIISKGIRGTAISVRVTEDQPTRHLADIVEILDRSSLSSSVREKAAAIFRRLAVAEATVHGEPIDRVHFHEVGAVDAIVDIVGSAFGLDRLGVEAVFCSPLPSGSGKVRGSHGVLPVPAPATLELARVAGAPLTPTTVEGELVTPTGAAIVTTLATFSQPAMRVESIGYGFGRKEFPWANALRLWLGQPTGVTGPRDHVSLLETNLDDATGEAIGAAMDELLRLGALDVFFSPIQMKKNRPATKLSVICRPDDEPTLARAIIARTSTLGVRVQRLTRYTADRWQETVQTPWGAVRVKVKSFNGAVSAAPEHDDCVRIAVAADVSVADVYGAARAAGLLIGGIRPEGE